MTVTCDTCGGPAELIFDEGGEPTALCACSNCDRVTLAREESVSLPPSYRWCYAGMGAAASAACGLALAAWSAGGGVPMFVEGVFALALAALCWKAATAERAVPLPKLKMFDVGEVLK